MRPKRCFRCESVVVKYHCHSPTCDWVRCDNCKGVSAIILGQPRFFAEKNGKKAGK